MILVPFIFFAALTVYWWRERKGIDVCSYMSLLYAVSSFLAIMIVMMGEMQGKTDNENGGVLWGGWDIELGFIPTVSYCLLLGLCILPFSFVNVKEIKKIETRAPWSLLAFSALLIAVAFVNLYCVADSTLDILSGDLSFVRQGAYKGDQTPAEIKAATLPFPLGHLTYLNFCTTLALPIMFYNLCFDKKPWWWNALLLFTAMTPILAGIQRADRTEPIYFSLMFVYCIVFFRHHFSRKVKIAMGSVIAVLVVFGATYVTAVSVARFDERYTGGAAANVVQYGGQSYLNYCYFCEYGSFATVESEREFPLINHFGANIDSDDIRRSERSAREGFFIAVFATFLGDILLDLGPVGMGLWVLGYALLVTLVIRHKKRTEFDMSEILILFFLASIPLFGIFYYRYFAWMIGLNYVLIFLFWVVSNNKIVYEKVKSKLEYNE